MFQMSRRLPDSGSRPPGRSALWLRIVVAAALVALAAATAGGVVNAGRADARPPVPPATVNLPADPPVSTGRLLVTLPWGTGPAQVGLQSPGEGLRRGPEALAVAPDGLIAVLDSVNQRVLVLSSGGEPRIAIPVNLAEPRFLAVSDTAFYVLDSDSSHRILGWDRNGALVLDQELVFPSDPPVTALLVRNGEPSVEVGHDRVYPLSALLPRSLQSASAEDTRLAEAASSAASLVGRPSASGNRLVQARFSPAQGVRMSLFAPDGTPVSGAPSHISLAGGRRLEYLVSVDAGGGGRPDDLLVGAHLLPQAGTAARTDAPEPSLFVARIPTDGSGRPAVAILLPESCFAYVGQPYAVGPDGSVYQPQTSPDGYSIVVHTLSEGSEQ
jgi:hypothetical protein